MSGEDTRGEFSDIAKALASWTEKVEGIDARQVLIGLGHLGSFLKAVSKAEQDLELGLVDSEPTWEEDQASVGASIRSLNSVSQSSNLNPSTASDDIQLPSIYSVGDDEDANRRFRESFPKAERKLLRRFGFITTVGILSFGGPCLLLATYPELMNATCDGKPTRKDFSDAQSLVDSNWILTEPLRKSLYSHIFIPTQQSNEVIFENIIREKVTLIRNLQRFMLHFICSVDVPAIQLPNLRFLVEDAITMVQILQTPLPSHTFQNVEKYHPFHHFDQLRYETWKDLGYSESNVNTFWKKYKIDLCDAILGLWHHQDQDSFLHDRKESAGSIRSILSCLDLNHRHSKSIPVLDSSILDASFIISNGPFRFKRTPFLHEHLTVQDKDILIFTDLEKLAGMRHHAVLYSDNPLCMFDMLTSEERYTPTQTVNIRPFISRLHYSVQTSLFLLFYQNPISDYSPRKHRQKFNIARDLGLNFGGPTDIKDIANSILADHPTWDSFLDRTTEIRLHDPFMVPLDKLYTTLTEWKPRTFWEMRFPGYGNVDVVNLYGFYFGFMVGIAAVIALMLTAAQTYTGFKGLAVNH